jgi:hypothetical protein
LPVLEKESQNKEKEILDQIKRVEAKKTMIEVDRGVLFTISTKGET